MLAERIEQDFKVAMKARDTVKVETLRMLKSALGNYLIEKRKQNAEEPELIGLIQKQIKLRQDSIEGFKKGGRQDLVDKESREKAILEAYLPASLSDAEVELIVKKAIEQTGAKTKQDLGKVMKEALAESQGRADGKRINQVASKLLS
jgi:uncharacterized protein YqeY